MVSLSTTIPPNLFAGDLDRVQGPPRNEIETDPRPASGYGFLTTSPNSVVEPIHPKATPVIRRLNEERDVWMRAPGMRQGTAASRCPARLSRSVARGADKEDKSVA